MIQLLIPLIALLTIAWFFGAYRSGTPEKRKRLVFGFLFLVLLCGVLYLTLTGRLHFIAAIVTALLPFVKKLLPFIRYIPLLRRFVKKQPEDSGQGGATSAKMSRAQAYEVLGLKFGATREEVIDAHRKLMQKCHPDRGGNDYLASQLNQAKDTLLS